MPEAAETSTRRWSRAAVAAKIAGFEHGYQRTPSQRQLAQKLQVPRTTLQHWLKRKQTLDADPAVVAFFESPAGVAFLHRLVIAAHLVMTLVGPCGIRLVCLFLELTGLDQFVAASYGPQQKVSVSLEQAVVAFGQAEKDRLAAGMPPKQITVCEDETFHPEVCLVAIEPVSNFILLEQYADNRRAETWTRAAAEATAGLPVTIVQSTSDEGRGILHHVKEDLGVHHSPDLFHVQYELIKGTSLALASQQRQAGEALAEIVTRVSRDQEKKAAALNDPTAAELAAELAQKIKQAQAQERQAQQALEVATEQQARAREAIQGISAAYHPYDLKTGAARNAAQVSATLNQHFAKIETVATTVNLAERGRARIQKAKRVVVEMVATIAFFFLTVQAKVEALALAPAVERAVYNNLIPAIYLRLVSEKTPDPEQRAALQAQSDALLLPLAQSAGPLAGLEAAEKGVIETVARECAQLFQRASSCVEGRNGQLALRHHSLHRISKRKLAALTTVHNYFIERDDGTTAAERFFGAKPRDLFEYVLDRVNLPGRSAQKRSQPSLKAYLTQAIV